MFVTLMICVSLVAVCGATTSVDGKQRQRAKIKDGMNISVGLTLTRQKRALSFFARKGVPALQKLISETTPINSGSKTTKSYEKRGNYYTALRDLFSVADPKIVRERKTGNGLGNNLAQAAGKMTTIYEEDPQGKIVEGFSGNKKLRLTSPGRGDTTLDIFENAFKRPTLGDVLQTQRIIYRSSKQ